MFLVRLETNSTSLAFPVIERRCLVTKKRTGEELTHILVAGLGIPKNQLPPDYYRLLGLERFESDSSKIEAGARRQLKVLQGLMSTGEAPSVRLVASQVAKAKTCLLDPLAREAYDIKLGASKSFKQVGIPPKNAGSGPHRSHPPRPPGNVKHSRAAIGSTVVSVTSDVVTTRPEPGPRPPHPSKSFPSVRLGARPVKQPPQGRRKPDIKQSTLLVAVSLTVVAVIASLGLMFVFRGSDEGDDALANAVETEDTSPPQQRDQEKSGGEEVPGLPETEKPQGEDGDSSKTPKGQSTDSKTAPPDEDTQESPETPKPPEEEVPPRRDEVDPAGPLRPDANANPFELLPSAVSLPPIERHESQLARVDLAPFEIGPLPGNHAKELELSLRTAAASLPDSREFHLIKLRESDFDAEWECHMRRSVDADAKEKSQLAENANDLPTMVARLRLQAETLLFLWSELATDSLAGQLRNAKLELVAGVHRHEMRLRPIEELPPVLLTFNQRSQRIELQGPSLPSVKQLFLEVLGLDPFPVASQQVPQDGRASFGEQVRIQPTEWQDAEIRVTFAGNRKKPEVVIAGFYKLRKRWVPMTIEKVDDNLSQLRQSFNENKVRLNQFASDSKQTATRFDQASARLPRARNLAESVAIQAEMKLLGGRQKKNLKGIKAMQRLLPKTAESIQRLEALVNLGNRLHEVAKIHFRVAATTDEGDFDLLVANGLPAQ